MDGEDKKDDEDDENNGDNRWYGNNDEPFETLEGGLRFGTHERFSCLYSVSQHDFFVG